MDENDIIRIVDELADEVEVEVERIASIATLTAGIGAKELIERLMQELRDRISLWGEDGS